MTFAFAPERIETWPLSRLQPYAKNAKMHGADQVAKIAANMAEFGWTVPCLVAEDRELIAVYGRMLAATQLGLTEAQRPAAHRMDRRLRSGSGARIAAALLIGRILAAACRPLRPRAGRGASGWWA